jgi:hypothetical protein
MDRVDYQSLIVQDLVNDHSDDKLNLNPWYQRRSVWTRPQKAYLINTLFERKPIPALYIRHYIDAEKSKSVKEVVDGQQRARAVIEYCNGEFTAKTDAKSGRKTFAQLSKDERERFLLTPLPIGFLLGATDADVIDIFARINSVSKTLNAQEKRNSQYSGEFKQFALSESTSRLELWRNLGIFTANDIARMNEVQFTSDVVYNLINGLSDFRPSALNKLYADNDEEFPEQKEISERLDNIFEHLYKLDKGAITDTIFQRQPLFFSLMLAIDGKKAVKNTTLERALRDIDTEFNDEDLVSDEIVAFRKAATASTQRISSRKVRDAYIRARL